MPEQDDIQSRQEEYEKAYYEAAAEAGAAQPVSDAAQTASEQYHADPFVAAMSNATTQREEGTTGQASYAPQAQPFVDNAYQQPWDSNTTQGQYSYSQHDYGQQSYQQPYNQGYQQTYQTYVKTKDHVAAGLLAIFLGSLGVHKFYLGYNNAGFIMLGATIIGSLFTFGLAGAAMGVIALVEGILYLTKSQNVFDAEYVYGHKEWF